MDIGKQYHNQSMVFLMNQMHFKAYWKMLTVGKEVKCLKKSCHCCSQPVCDTIYKT